LFRNRKMCRSRNVAVMGFYGQGNAGDEALLSSVVMGLKSSEAVQNITVLSSYPEQTMREHKVSAVHNFFPATLKELVTRLLGRNRANFIRSLLVALKCNTLIIGGGGLFFDKPDENYHLIRLLKIIWLFEMLGKEVFMVGVSIDKLNAQGSIKNLQRTLNHKNMKAVISRDERSTSIFKNNSIQKNIFYSTEDIAFCLTPSTDTRINDDFLYSYIEKNKNNIGLSLCGYRLSSNPRYRNEIRVAVSRLLSLGHNVVIIPMSVGSDNDREGIVSSLTGLDNFEAIKCVNEDLTVQQNISLLGMMDCVIAERLHASILCIIANTPVIGVSYASKVLEMYKSINREQWQKDSELLDQEWLLERVEYSLNNKVELKNELICIAKEKSDLATESFVILSGLLTK